MTEEEIRRIASEPIESCQEAGEALDAALALIDKLKLRECGVIAPNVITLWTTGEPNAVPWADTHFWADEESARTNAEASGEPLLRIAAEVLDAEEVWRP